MSVAVATERDVVRLLVAAAGGLEHARFEDLLELLSPGDLLVVNDSATLPAALPLAGGLRLHLSTPLPRPGGAVWEPDDPDSWRAPDSGSSGDDRASWPADGFERWVVELRRGGERFRGGQAGERFALPAGGEAELLARYLGGSRLWAARLRLPEPLHDYLARHGAPIRYRHATTERPLADHQTIFAAHPGSAEMPSAGRPFTDRLVTRLLARGIAFAAVTLHTGVSSLEAGEPPYPERFRVPAATAAAVNRADRVVAVGTTVVRALETVARPDGTVEPGRGWTRLVIDPERGVRAVDGLITGWHDPDASHLQLLEALAGRELIVRSYAVPGYRRHEFGDSHLLLP
ncbi:MAG: S-adenosylmethionine:tRNA ribosyltransferase-isomerase [Solirubrobacteraceae bacterium]